MIILLYFRRLKSVSTSFSFLAVNELRCDLCHKNTFCFCGGHLSPSNYHASGAFFVPMLFHLSRASDITDPLHRTIFSLVSCLACLAVCSFECPSWASPRPLISYMCTLLRLSPWVSHMLSLSDPIHFHTLSYFYSEHSSICWLQPLSQVPSLLLQPYTGPFNLDFGEAPF